MTRIKKLPGPLTMKNRHSITWLFVLGLLALAPAANALFVVRMETVEGNIDLLTRDDVAPGTVANFIDNYVDQGAYDNTFIQRTQSLVPDLIGIIQGGGYVWNDAAAEIAAIPIVTTINSESYFPNLRGTIAMALTSGDVNSGTNQWFINTVDNSNSLDSQGFTVFGTVIGDGMTVVDRLAALPVLDASTLPENDTLALQAPLNLLPYPLTQLLHGIFGSLPLVDYTSGAIQRQNVALIPKVRVMVRGPLGSYGTLADLPGDNYAMLSLTLQDFAYGFGVVVDSFASVANPHPSDTPAGVAFDQGFFSFRLSNVVTDSIGVVLSVPDGQRPDTYYKFGPTPDNHDPHWYNFMYDQNSGTGAIIDGSMIALVFVDGERGDDDYTKNGVIEDVGAPGVKAAEGGGGAADLWSLLAGLLAMGLKLQACRFKTCWLVGRRAITALLMCVNRVQLNTLDLQFIR